MKYLILFPIALFLGCSQPAKEVESKIDISQLDDNELKTFSKEFAQKTIITDGHVELPYRMKVAGFMLKKEIMDVSQLTDGNFDFPKSVEGGLDAPFMSIYIPSSYQITGGAKSLADSLIDMVNQISVTYPDKFAPATTPAEVEANFAAKKISLPMGMENGAPIESDLDNVKYFYDRGIRYITLTHGKDNQICDSSYDTTRTWNGLSPFGREVVLEMNKVGIMVDVSHISDSAFYQVMELTKVPAIASHSSARHFTPDFERNMSDDMIIKLAKNGGVIQINFGSTFLSRASQEKFDAMRENVVNYLAENNLKREDDAAKQYMQQYISENDPFENVNMVANHIDHVVKLAGIDHVALGSDYDGVGDTLPTGLKDVSEYPNLIFELFKRGYSEEDLEKICYKNVFRVWNQTAEYAANQN